MQISMIGSRGSFHGEGSLVIEYTRDNEIVIAVHQTGFSITEYMKDGVYASRVAETLAVQITLANAVVVANKDGKIHIAIHKHGFPVRYFALSPKGLFEISLPPDASEVVQ